MPNPNNDPYYLGFGKLTKADLTKRYGDRVYVNAEDRKLILALWNAYRKKDDSSFMKLSASKSICFPTLGEVCQAHLDRNLKSGFGRPQIRLKSIINGGASEFDKIFTEFRMTEGIYGFGDMQVKKMLNGLSD